MKKYLLITLAFVSLNSIAQNIELTGFGGYMLNGKMQTYYYGEYPVSDGATFGGILGIEVAQNNFVELSYSRCNTDFSYSRTGIVTTEPISMALEYYQIGSSQVFDVHEVVKPFAGLSLGATRFAPQEGYDWDGDGSITNLSDAWRFSAALGAGLKFMLSDKVGIRLQARMLLPMEFNGLFIGIGTGGASGGASFRVPMISGDFTGGLIFRLGSS